MDRLLLTLTYFLALMFLASCSGDCDTCELPPSKFKNFDIERFKGKPWHIYLVTPPSFADNYTCWTDKIYKAHNGSYYMHSTFTDASSCSTIETIAAVVIKNGNIMDLAYSETPEWNYPYYVYGTDYKSYAVVGGCPEAIGGKPFVWIYYTSWNPTKAAQKAAESVLKKYGLDQYEYVKGCTDIPKQE